MRLGYVFLMDGRRFKHWRQHEWRKKRDRIVTAEKRCICRCSYCWRWFFNRTYSRICCTFTWYDRTVAWLYHLQGSRGSFLYRLKGWFWLIPKSWVGVRFGILENLYQSTIAFDESWPVVWRRVKNYSSWSFCKYFFFKKNIICCWNLEWLMDTL